MVRAFDSGLVDGDGSLKKGTGMSGVTGQEQGIPIHLAHRSRVSAGGIPILMAKGSSMALAWENSLLELWQNGCHIENQYEEDLPEGHELSVDATMIMVVEDPLSEPAIHRSFPGGLADLEEYRLEFIDGIKDHWVRDPKEPGYAGEWTYTYHQRFSKYSPSVYGTDYAAPSGPPGDIDQIDEALRALTKSPHSRRVQCATWQPWIDLYTEDPPCCQSFWFRCSADPTVPGGYVLNANVRFRSRDAYDAAFMNLWGEVAFIVKFASDLQCRLGKPVRVGRLVDISDSYHIYGKRVQHFCDAFLTKGMSRSLEERTWTREFAQPLFDEARPKILEKVRLKDAGLPPAQ
jgi:thymidylate synthase